jgi:molybdopterin molybdotransferase
VSEVGLDQLISVAEAIALLDAQPVVARTERIALSSADGRVLAKPVSADRDYPPFDKALMDGFAVRAADGDGVRKCIGEIAAGAPAVGRALKAGECFAIMTGAPMPAGSDAVIPVEWTRRDGNGVTTSKAPWVGHALLKRAAENKAGDPLLEAGVTLGPAQLSVCAQVGAALVDVFARPRVGIVSSGNEVVAFDTIAVGTQIRNSNSILLTSLVRRFGAQVEHLGHVADDPAAIAEVLQTPNLDAILITGGMSMGEYDYTPKVLRNLGYELAITKLKMKPGKPFVFARKANAPFVFGLPGNPVSAFVCTVRLVSRLLCRFGGGCPDPQWETANLTDALPANGPREFYLPVHLDSGQVTPLRWGGSADIVTLAQANGLLVRMADQGPLQAGTKVVVLRLP